MIPHIVFHAPSDDYFPARRCGASPIRRRPPVLRSRRCWRPRCGGCWQHGARPRVGGCDGGLGSIRRLLRNHRWWQHGARSGATRPGGDAASLGNRDGQFSPAWDVALARVPTDTDHASSSPRHDRMWMPRCGPRGEEYQRFIHLVDVFRDAGWQPARMLCGVSPFRVADIGTNAILLRAERTCWRWPRGSESAEDRSEIDARIARLSTALDRLWRDDLGLYRAWT